VTPTALVAAWMLAGGGGVLAQPPLETVRDAKHGLTFAVPAGWKTETHSSYEIVSRGPMGGLETHVVVFAAPDAALRSYFLSSNGEMGTVDVHAGWTCAASRVWRLNPSVDVAVCSRQLSNGHSLVASLTGEKAWLRKVGGVRFLRVLVARMHGFRAEDD
jgi:hypothetical protein